MSATWVLTATALLVSATTASAGSIRFRDLARDPAAGLAYGRVPSAHLAVAEVFRARGTIVIPDFFGNYPIKPYGQPGVAILDYDGDGDLDLYVTNGPGAANSLFESLLAQSGHLSFVDVAVAAGVDATDQDSTGVCFGDIDNDGDHDLYVLGRSEPNRLFENRGDGTFRDITERSRTGGGDLSSSTCSMGDVNGDGRLDIVVANSFDQSSNAAIFLEPFALNQRNQLFVNLGFNRFVDRSIESGVAAAQDITWAIALVDMDQDGDADVVSANDNGAIPFASEGGVDRGFIRYLKNDGTGHFTDVTAQAGLRKPGDWMGLSFADLDHNGLLDIFGSNSGDYFEPFLGIPVGFGEQATRWFLQQGDGTFTDPGVGPAIVAAPFGWGNAAFDYDHDGDTDLLSVGGLDAGPLVDCSDHGNLLANQGRAQFTLDLEALGPESADYTARIEHGMAVGDLDGNGFTDVVSVAAFDVPTGPGPHVPIPYPLAFGAPLDGIASFFPSWVPGPEPGTLVFAGAPFAHGSLAVELSSGNTNRWLQVRARGTIGLTRRGRVNRDGIGAVIRVTPLRGETAIIPVIGGCSYASQHSLAHQFGLGSAHRATVEVLWPGGVRNRVYNVRAGERLAVPEIPCRFDDPAVGFGSYLGCVAGSLAELVLRDVVEPDEAGRLLSSALRAFHDERR